jgi:hypothetical protein
LFVEPEPDSTDTSGDVLVVVVWCGGRVVVVAARDEVVVLVLVGADVTVDAVVVDVELGGAGVDESPENEVQLPPCTVAELVRSVVPGVP